MLIKYSVSCAAIIFSRILEKIHSKLIGRKSFSEVGLSHLGMGMTIAVFHLVGKIECLIFVCCLLQVR